MRKTVRRALLVLVTGTSFQIGLSQDQQAAFFSIEEIGLAQPESVLYELESDTYLVSNVNGSPFAEDDNGFISRLAPDGRVLELGWIDGTDPNVTLHAPKGSAVFGRTLFVADLTVVRTFDLETGRQGADIEVLGAGFLNDLVAAPDGTLYVSDTGVRAVGDGFEPTGTGAVYEISLEGTVRALTQNTDLGLPNGLAVLASGEVLVSTLDASGEVYALNAEGERRSVATVPEGGLDGVLALPDGSLLVSSWGASAVYRVGTSAQTTLLIEGIPSPADFGFDSQRGRLLIPVFEENRILVYPFDVPYKEAQSE